MTSASVHRRQRDGQRTGHDDVEAVGYRHGQRGVHGGQLGTAPAHRHHAVAGSPVAEAVTDLDDLAGQLAAGDERRRRRRPVVAAGRDRQVGPVDAGGLHPTRS